MTAIDSSMTTVVVCPKTFSITFRNRLKTQRSSGEIVLPTITVCKWRAPDGYLQRVN
jgi:hypothetical protein